VARQEGAGPEARAVPQGSFGHVGNFETSRCRATLVIGTTAPVQVRVRTGLRLLGPIVVTVSGQTAVPIEGPGSVQVEAEGIYGTATVSAELVEGDRPPRDLQYEVRGEPGEDVEHVVPAWADEVRLDTQVAGLSTAEFELYDPAAVICGGASAERVAFWMPLGTASLVKVTCTTPYRLLFRLSLI
jgi:hypothetical protein